MGYTYNVEQFKENFEREFTWLNGFMRNVARFGKQPAMYDPLTGKRWTYGELNADANRLANAMLADGLEKNDLIMFSLFNSPEFVLCYLAAHKTGSIAAPVNFRLSSGELAQLIDANKPKFFVFGEEIGATVREGLKLASWKPHRVLFAGSPDKLEKGEALFADYMKDASAKNPKITWPLGIYDETTRFFTSGTTHLPKGVPLNSLNEVLSSHDVIMHFPLNPTDRTMNMTPWFHRGGLHSGGPTPTLYAGGEVVVLREFSPKKCLAITDDERVTFLIGVPSILSLLARAQENSPVDISSLRGIVTMGSPFDKSACERYMKILTPNIFNGYGTTETFWNTFLRPFNLPEHAGTAGMSCTDDDVRVVRVPEDGGHGDPENMVAKDNIEVGEVIIRAPAKSAGCYVDNEELSREKFHNGYHYTGDLATWDKDSFITIVSRKDDMIISAGENIYPTPIEAVLNEHPKVAESAVVALPSRLHGQIVAAYVVPAEPDLTVEELRAHCLAHPMLPAFKRPRVYFLVDSIPHTATGKIMHYKLREQALASKK